MTETYNVAFCELVIPENEEKRVFRRGNSVKEELLEEERQTWIEYCFNRIEFSYSKKKTMMIQTLETAFFRYYDECLEKNNYPESYEKHLYPELKKCVDYWSKFYAKNWLKNTRLSYSDFESEFWCTVTWEVVKYTKKIYANKREDFFLFEIIQIALLRQGLDIVRAATKTDKGKFWHTMLSWEQQTEKWGEQTPSPVYVEKVATDKLFVSQLINDPVLTDEERRFLKALYDDPEASFQNLADVMGYSHREQARRKLRRIQKKLARYEANIY